MTADSTLEWTVRHGGPRLPAAMSGPLGLRLFKGFHDEALAGEWRGCRASRLGDQWRVIYCIVADDTLFQVESITAHDYWRP